MDAGHVDDGDRHLPEGEKKGGEREVGTLFWGFRPAAAGEEPAIFKWRHFEQFAFAGDLPRSTLKFGFSNSA